VKKILMTGIGDKMGGIESFATIIVEGLHDQYDFSFLAATKQKVARQDYFESIGVSVYHLKNIFGIKNAFTRTERIYEFLKENQFDTIHINATTLNAIYMIKAARKLNINVIYHIHNISPSGYGFFAKSITKFLAAYYRFRMRLFKNVKYIAVSKDAALAVFGKHIQAKVIVNGINTDRFLFNDSVRKSMRKKFNINDDAKVGIVIARLMSIKNHAKILDIVEKGLEKNYFDDFFIIGDGPEKDNIQSRIEGMLPKIKNRIRLCGEREDIPDFLMMSDFMLLTSFSEGLSISVIEAQAAGVVPIVSKGVPAVTNITDKVVFLDINKPDQYWLKKINSVLLDNYDRKKMNKLVQLSQFSSQSFLKAIHTIYGVNDENKN